MSRVCNENAVSAFYKEGDGGSLAEEREILDAVTILHTFIRVICSETLFTCGSGVKLS
jgi:hypothetical protein